MGIVIKRNCPKWPGVINFGYMKGVSTVDLGFHGGRQWHTDISFLWPKS